MSIEQKKINRARNPRVDAIVNLDESREPKGRLHKLWAAVLYVIFLGWIPTLVCLSVVLVVMLLVLFFI